MEYFTTLSDSVYHSLEIKSNYIVTRYFILLFCILQRTKMWLCLLGCPMQCGFNIYYNSHNASVAVCVRAAVARFPIVP